MSTPDFVLRKVMKPNNLQLLQLYTYVSSFTHADSIEELWQVVDYPYLQKLLLTDDTLAIQSALETVYEQHKVAAFTVPVFFSEEISRVDILAELLENPFRAEIRALIDNLGLQNIESDAERLAESIQENRLSTLRLDGGKLRTDSKGNELSNTVVNNNFQSNAHPESGHEWNTVTKSKKDKSSEKIKTDKQVAKNSLLHPDGIQLQSLGVPESPDKDNSRETNILQLQRFSNPYIVNTSIAALPAATAISNVNVLTKALTMPSNKKKDHSVAQRLNFMRLRKKSESKDSNEGMKTQEIPKSIDQQVLPNAKLNRRTSVVEDQLPLYIRQQIQEVTAAHSIAASSRVKSIISNSNSFYAARDTSRDASRDPSQGSTSEFSGERNTSDDDREYILPTLISRYLDYDDDDLVDIDFVNLSQEEEEDDENDEDILLFK